MARRYWEFRAQEPATPANAPASAELLIYGPIESDGGLFTLSDEVTPRGFREELEALGEIAELRVVINSPGGDVFAGQAIYSTLRRHPARVTVLVDGIAASSASLVAMAGDRIVMPRNAMLMIHNPNTMAVGDAREFRRMADVLDTVRDAMIAAYGEKTELPRAELIALLNAETWMTGDEAVEMGFADEIEARRTVTVTPAAAGVVAFNGHRFDLSGFRHLPDFAALAMKAEAIPPHRTAKADEAEAWQAPTLGDFTDERWEDLSEGEKRRIARHYVWTKEMPPETFGDLKGPHHKPTRSGDVGAVVWRAISSGRMHQMEEMRESGVRQHLEEHYHQFDRNAPWEEQSEDAADEAALAVAAAHAAYIAGR